MQPGRYLCASDCYGRCDGGEGALRVAGDAARPDGPVQSLAAATLIKSVNER